jgi:hypothetical protein
MKCDGAAQAGRKPLYAEFNTETVKNQFRIIYGFSQRDFKARQMSSLATSDRLPTWRKQRG